ncbi:MAG: BTAD domain-containing putative transcriptional regulator [Gaiellaceae bacterium]
MEFRILGPLEVHDDGDALDLRGQKQRALLALLLIEANRAVSLDRLIDALWEDEPTATAAKALQVYVSQLRKKLGRDRLVTQPGGGYLLRADPDEIDLTRFHTLHADGNLHGALALWRGPPLAEFAQQRFAQAEIAQLEELYLSCLESRLEADLAVGEHAALVGELEALVQRHPLRERLRGQHVLALYRCGRQADALAAYQDARTVLVDQLGIEPGKQLRELQQAILRQDPALEPAPAEPDDAGRDVFVGRDAELAQLVEALEDALASRGRLALLVGEPGIGKSRLAEELLRLARARGAHVLVGRCWEAGGAPAYWPWVQSLRGYADAAPPELAALLRGEPSASESESARFRLFDAVAHFLRDTAAGRPLVLFLDDLHAADEPSLLLLRFLARELGSMRLLVLGALRDVDPVPDRKIADMLAEVAREPASMRLSLHGLTEEAVADYLDAELASRELAATMHDETEGNPLFLTETVRLLAVEGRVAIPPSLRDVIARRLAHLGEECNRVLVHAAVLGREFDHGALARMRGISANELLEILDEAMIARVVSDVPGAGARSRFAHVLIRDALYDGLTSARRASLHRKACEVLEDDAELAFHAVAGHDFERALVCARRAGDRALALLAYEEAARLYDVALSARPDARTRCELLLARGEAEIRAGDTSRAKDTFLDGAAIARELGLPHALAGAALGYGGRIVWVRAGNDRHLVPLLEEAIAALPQEEVKLRSRLLARLAGALRDDHARDRRDALSKEAVELARASADPAILAYALDARGYAILAADTLEECLGLARELREAAEVAGDTERVVAGHMLAIMTLVVRGEISATESELESGARLAGHLGQRAQLSQIDGVRALLALAAGRLAEGEALSIKRFELGRPALLEESTAIYRCQRHQLHDLRGTLAEVESEIAELAADYPARPVFRCVLAQVHARLGRVEEARLALAELARDDGAALPFDQEWLYAMSLLAETAALVGDAGAAAGLYRALTPWAELNAVDVAEGCRGAVSRYLGLLAATLGLREESAAHFEHAIAMNERMGFRPWVARTQQDYAQLLGADELGTAPR